MATEKLTEDQLNWIRKHYHDGDWADLAKMFNREFGLKKSGDALRILYNRYKHKDLSGSEVPFADFTRDSFGSSTLNIKEGRYFVTGVMPLNPIGAKIVFGNAMGGTMAGYVDQHAFLTLRETVDAGFCKPILLAGTAHTQLGQKQPNYYDPALKPWRDWFTSGVTFNKHLQAVDMRILPQQAHPLTGLQGVKTGSSLIVAHPKQDMRFISQGNELLPLLHHSTGCLNERDMYQDNRIGNLAYHAHKIGGLLVELKGERFFVRQVQFDKNGGFYDRGMYRVAGEKPRKVRAQAVKVGDFHFGHDMEPLWVILADIFEETQPKVVFIEDPRDGYSHSHHIRNMPDKVKRAKSDWGRDIRSEVELVKSRMERLKKIIPKDCQIVFTDDNHGRFLKRYVDECRYMNDIANFEMGHELQLLNLKERNLWQELIDPKREYVFLDASQDFLLDNWQFGSHGDRGLNGNRNPKGAYPKVVDAHGHSPWIEGDHWRAGHWSEPRHGYNEGASNWMPSVVVKYPGDCLQQIIPIKAPKDKKDFEWKL
jgi:hypothetical protein